MNPKERLTECICGKYHTSVDDIGMCHYKAGKADRKKETLAWVNRECTDLLVDHVSKKDFNGCPDTCFCFRIERFMREQLE